MGKPLPSETAARAIIAQLEPPKRGEYLRTTSEQKRIFDLG